jgi:hypothetical protein
VEFKSMGRVMVNKELLKTVIFVTLIRGGKNYFTCERNSGNTYKSERPLSINLQCVDRLSTEKEKKKKNHN